MGSASIGTQSPSPHCRCGLSVLRLQLGTLGAQCGQEEQTLASEDTPDCECAVSPKPAKPKVDHAAPGNVRRLRQADWQRACRCDEAQQQCAAVSFAGPEPLFPPQTLCAASDPDAPHVSASNEARHAMCPACQATMPNTRPLLCFSQLTCDDINAPRGQQDLHDPAGVPPQHHAVQAPCLLQGWAAREQAAH